MSDRTQDQDEQTAIESRGDDTWHVQLPDRVGSKIAERVQRTEFDSVDEYVAFVMESVLRELDEQDDDADDYVEYGDGEKSEELHDRLESLGYM